MGNGRLIEKPESSRNDYGYTLGGPVYIPGAFNEDKKKLFFFWSQEFQRRSDPANERQGRVPTELERRGDFSRSVDNNGNPFPYIRDYTTGLPCCAADTRGCFQDGGVIGRIPQNRLYTPGLNVLSIYPAANFTAGSGINFTSQIPNESPRREDLLRLDFQATDKWRFTGRYMNTKEEILQAYGTTWAGNGSDQLPMPVLFQHPGKNYLLSTTGILSPTTSLEVSLGRAENSLNYDLQQENLFRSAAGLSGLPLLTPDAVQADYIPWFEFRSGRTGNAGQYQTDRGPFTNENITHDVLANLSKIFGAHSTKFGVYYQHSFKPQSIFAEFNSRINFGDDANNPFDTGYRIRQRRHRRVQPVHPGQQIRPAGVGLQQHRVLRAGQLEGQPQAHARLRRALLQPDPAVGPDPAGLELPARALRLRQRGEAVPAGVHRRLSLLRRQPARHGPQARQLRRRPHARQHGGGALHRPPRPRLQPVQRGRPGR